MPHYMIQAAYTPEAWAGLAKQPQDRSRAIRPMVKNLKGRVVSFYNSFGDYDAVVIVELPDNEAAAAIAIAASAGGALKAIKTTRDRTGGSETRSCAASPGVTAM